MGPLRRYLTDDHARLDELLAQSVSSRERFDTDAFERFRVGLLRHIGIEEKLLLLEARKRNGGTPLPAAARLRIEHAALASLLVPTPDHALVTEIRTLLAAHNELEERDGGVYAAVEELAAGDVEDLVQRARAVRDPPPARHFDGPGVMRTAADALALAESNAARVEARKKQS